MPGAVDEHGVVVVDEADDAAAVNDGLVAVLLLQLEGVEDGGAGGADVGLRLGMDFQQAVEAFDDLHAGGDLGAFEGHVGDAVDLHAGGNFDEEGGLAGDGQKALRYGREERRDLRLEAVEEDVGA